MMFYKQDNGKWTINIILPGEFTAIHGYDSKLIRQSFLCSAAPIMLLYQGLEELNYKYVII